MQMGGTSVEKQLLKTGVEHREKGCLNTKYTVPFESSLGVFGTPSSGYV